MATGAPLPTETPNGTPPSQTVLNDGQTADSDLLDELYEDSRDGSDEEGDARYIQNWVGEVDNAFDVFDMDRDDYHPDDPSDLNTADLDQEDLDELDELLKHMELHRFSR